MPETATKPTTARALQKEAEASVLEFCADHVAEISEDGKRITFGKPGTSVYRQHFRMDGRWLMTYGDLGEAIYEWSQAVSWAFLAGCDYSYFIGKCQASPHGAHPKGWDGDVALTGLREWFAEAQEYGIQKTWKEFDEEVLPWVSWSQREEWYGWLREGNNGHEWFGDEWYDSVAVRCGEVHDTHSLHQWKMLQLAVERLGLDRESAHG